MDAVPVVDLFAGPGGLGEGFSSLATHRRFRIALSIEMDPTARATLMLRAFYRQFATGAPPGYYDYVHGDIERGDLAKRHPAEWEHAELEAWCAELGQEDRQKVRKRVRAALADQGAGPFVVIGGPPCQAYSLVGRSRMRPVRGEEFDSDHRHLLYREYLQILADHAPAVFVLENVKGLLSSTRFGEQMFQRIVEDLRAPRKALSTGGRPGALEYELFPLGQSPDRRLFELEFSPRDFVLRSEELGIPQARHRVIVLGVHRELADRARDVLGQLDLRAAAAVSLNSAISDLPAVRSGLSRTADSDESWVSTVRALARGLGRTRGVSPSMHAEFAHIEATLTAPRAGRGAEFIPGPYPTPAYRADWYTDPSLRGVLNHSSRSHIVPDLERYLFASVFAHGEHRSPQLVDFPERLLPRHRNVKRALGGNLFSDRFRVQLADRPSTTITSHISKDGHYFIHPDPLQCRSLTVREAARLQTFPDNYFFEGPRTAQYHQVGNAVPPLLAQQIAGAVAAIMAP